MSKKNLKPVSDYGPVSQKSIALRANPDAMQAIEDYQAYMRKNHNLLISTNKAINALLILGQQYVKDAQAEAAK